VADHQLSKYCRNAPTDEGLHGNPASSRERAIPTDVQGCNVNPVKRWIHIGIVL
jgi:hypothetical protein